MKRWGTTLSTEHYENLCTTFYFSIFLVHHIKLSSENIVVAGDDEAGTGIQSS